MQSDTELDILLDFHSAQVREMLRNAYESGRVAGRREAAEQIQTQLSGWMTGSFAMQTVVRQEDTPEAPEPQEHMSRTPVIESGIPMPSARAPRGAIRASLLDVLKEGSATLEQVVNRTGHNPNSVRSTLYLLRGEGTAKRDGELWSLTTADDRTTEPEEPAPEDAEAEEGDQHPDPESATDQVATSQDAADTKPLF